MSNKQLVRPQEGRVLFGVCAGLGQYFGIDPTLVRILWVLLTFVAGTGVLLYVILAIVMPNASAVVTTTTTTTTSTTAPTGTSLGGEIVEQVETAIDRATTDGDGPGGA